MKETNDTDKATDLAQTRGMKGSSQGCAVGHTCPPEIARTAQPKSGMKPHTQTVTIQGAQKIVGTNASQIKRAIHMGKK